MRAVLGLAVVGILFASACSETKVALNERLFDRPSLQSLGAGCTLYELGGGGSSGTTTSLRELTIAQRSDGGDQILVDVSQNDGTRATQRRYDRSFFESGRLDEFVLRTPSGSELLLKYWGTADSAGFPACAPLDDNGPLGALEAAAAAQRP